MRTQTPVRAIGLVSLCSVFVWFVAACAAPPSETPTPTGAVDGLVTEGGLFGRSGVVVRVQGQTTLTDADGRFTFEGITVPYDLSLSQTSGDGWLHVIEGVTDRAPTIDPVGPSVVLSAAPTADVAGSLSGGGVWPLPAGRRVVVCVEGRDGVLFGCDTLAPGESAYDLTVALLLGESSDVRLHGLRMVVDGDGRPTGYEGYGFVDTSLGPGDAIVVPLNLGVVPAVGDLEVAFDVPGGASLTEVIVSLRLFERGSLTLLQDAPAGNSLTLPVPVLPGARYAVYAGATTGPAGATSWNVADGLDVGTIAFGVPPQLTAPATAATDVTTETAFEVVVAGSGPRTFRWATSGAGPDVALTTTRSSVTLPDLAQAGLAWPSGGAYSWRVTDHDAATVDDAAATLDPSILGLAILIGLDVSTSGGHTSSEVRYFTLAP